MDLLKAYPSLPIQFYLPIAVTLSNCWPFPKTKQIHLSIQEFNNIIKQDVLRCPRLSRNSILKHIDSNTRLLPLTFTSNIRRYLKKDQDSHANPNFDPINWQKFVRLEHKQANRFHNL